MDLPSLAVGTPRGLSGARDPSITESTDPGGLGDYVTDAYTVAAGGGAFDHISAKGVTVGSSNVMVDFRSGHDTVGAHHRFVDSVAHPHLDAINWLVDEGLTSGCTPMLFCPNRLLIRAEAATFVRKAMGLTVSDDDGPFTDHPKSVHRTNINAIRIEGVTSGCNPPADTRFCRAARSPALKSPPCSAGRQVLTSAPARASTTSFRGVMPLSGWSEFKVLHGFCR